jgi:hypothetical protein
VNEDFLCGERQTGFANKLTKNENYRNPIRIKRNSTDQVQNLICKESGRSNTTNISQLRPVTVCLKKHAGKSKSKRKRKRWPLYESCHAEITHSSEGMSQYSDATGFVIHHEF